jgi:molybdopterin-guanine dinucleotide biosynthesis protein B
MSGALRISAAFTGPSGSGKTTLILKVIALIKERGQRPVIVKTNRKDKASFDMEGKDSHTYFTAGADVIVPSPSKTVTIFHSSGIDLDSITAAAGDFDYLLIEGMRDIPLPKIALFRGSVDPEYIQYADAAAVDADVDRSALPRELTVLDINSPSDIFEWINRFGKRN